MDSINGFKGRLGLLLSDMLWRLFSIFLPDMFGRVPHVLRDIGLVSKVFREGVHCEQQRSL